MNTAQHSRGTMVEKIMVRHLQNLGITDLPVRKQTYIGAAAHISGRLDDMRKNNYVDSEGISPTLLTSGNVTDFVHFLVGANPTNGGLGKGFFLGKGYSHSGYTGDEKAPTKFIIDDNGQPVKYNGKEIENPLYEEYIKIWPEPTKGNDSNASLPVATVKGANGDIYFVGRDGKARIVDTRTNQVTESDKDFEILTTPKGTRYFEFEGRKYHADPF